MDSSGPSSARFGRITHSFVRGGIASLEGGNGGDPISNPGLLFTTPSLLGSAAITSSLLPFFPFLLFVSLLPYSRRRRRRRFDI
jgi:hypothetical protein